MVSVIVAEPQKQKILNSEKEAQKQFKAYVKLVKRKNNVISVKSE